MKVAQSALETLGGQLEKTQDSVIRLGSENSRPNGGCQEHAQNPSRPQPTTAGKGLTI